MDKKIDDIMKQKLDTVLDTVKEPESALSVGEIGIAVCSIPRIKFFIPT